MPTYKTYLTNKFEVAEGTMAFEFEKPEGFEFKPGQNSDFTLHEPKETDAEGNTRTFSLACSPSEPVLRVATRMRDTAFKRSLREMAAGAEIELDGPHGSFTLHNDASKAAVFLSGGIGITPFYSIAKDAAERQLPHKITLFYSNRRPEDAAFLQQISELPKANPNFTFVPTMTEMDKSSQHWDGETGIINKDMIQKYIANLAEAIFYIAGPPGMVEAMRKLLNEAGVNDDYIRTEEFAGY